MIKIKRHTYLIISFVALTVFILFICLNWEKISSNSSILALYFGILGALIGGICGGVGSYYGGILGAKENFQLNLDLKEKQYKRLLLIQLKYTYNIIIALNTTCKDEQPFPFIICFFDNDWYEKLTYLQGITDEEMRNIVNWFLSLIQLEKGVVLEKRLPTVAEVKMLMGDRIPEIRSILEKYGYMS